MGSSPRQVLEEDLERTKRLIEVSGAALEAAEAVAQEKKETICAAEIHRDWLTGCLESEESEFWSRFGESEGETPSALERPVPPLKTTFDGLQSSKKHLDKMMVYALANSGRVVPREAAELLISLGLSDSKTVRNLSKNLTTAMAGSKEFNREPDGTFVLVARFSTAGYGTEEQVSEQGSSSSYSPREEDRAAPDSGCGTAAAESDGS